MELQFERNVWECLKTVTAQPRSEEQTQEVRLSDAMPDIGRVVGCWGQVLLRGKDWRSGGMNISCGVMAWVLYVPEDGSEPQTVDTWIPFQMKWDFPDTKHDGYMNACCSLAAVDARSVSARKLMVRATVSVMGEALEPIKLDVCTPGTVEKDVQLLRRSYPVRLPREAGEKSFALEEELTLPGGNAAKLLRYSMQPEIIDQKVMAGKVVFRGSALIHVLCQCEDDSLKGWDLEVPFSQFADLEREYGDDAQVRVIPAVTGLDLEQSGPDRLTVKAGLTGQYTVTDQSVLELTEDAYSTIRAATPRTMPLELPAVLDDRQETVRMEQAEGIDGERILDTACMLRQPSVRREGDRLTMEMEMAFQLLYYDREGNLQGKLCTCRQERQIAADENCGLNVRLRLTGNPQVVLGAGSVNLRGDVLAQTVTTAAQGMPMVTGLELGEVVLPDPNRPSLILRRAGRQKLWDMAKENRSTVAAICQANHLAEEPEEGRMLLIPVN